MRSKMQNSQGRGAPMPPALYARHLKKPSPGISSAQQSTLGTAADFERSDLGIVGFALIGDVDALDSCGGRTTIDSPFAATVSD
jgi:hypothetical protein